MANKVIKDNGACSDKSINFNYNLVAIDLLISAQQGRITFMMDVHL